MSLASAKLLICFPLGTEQAFLAGALAWSDLHRATIKGTTTCLEVI